MKRGGEEDGRYGWKRQVTVRENASKICMRSRNCNFVIRTSTACYIFTFPQEVVCWVSLYLYTGGHVSELVGSFYCYFTMNLLLNYLSLNDFRYILVSSLLFVLFLCTAVNLRYRCRYIGAIHLRIILHTLQVAVIYNSTKNLDPAWLHLSMHPCRRS